MSKPPNPDNLQANRLRARESWGRMCRAQCGYDPKPPCFPPHRNPDPIEMIWSLEREKLEPDVDNEKRHLRGPISGRRQAVEATGFWSKAHLSANRTFGILQMQIHNFFNMVLNSTVHKIAWDKAGKWVPGSLVSLIVFWQFAKINAILQAPWNGNTALFVSINSPAPGIFGKSRLKTTKDPGKSLQKLPLHWRRNASERPPQGSGHTQTSPQLFWLCFLLWGFFVSP